MLENQKPWERNELLARAFKLQSNELLKDLVKDHCLGRCIANIHVVEFQKRGLPHRHLLIFFDKKDKIRNAEDIDRIISAEIPDPDEDPEYYNTVKTSLVHGPCGPDYPRGLKKGCWDFENHCCSKGYPKPLQSYTSINDRGYPNYCRTAPKDGGRTLTKKGV